MPLLPVVSIFFGRWTTDSHSPSVQTMRYFHAFVFLGLGCCSSMLVGQTPPTSKAGQCSLVLLNALPGPQNLHVKFGAEDIWSPGFTPGQSTGGVLFPSGKKSVEMLCAGFAPSKEEVFLPPGGNFAMVFFPGEAIKDGPDKGKKKIALFCPPPILPDRPPQGKNWHILLAGPLAQARLSVNAKMVDLKLGQPTTPDAGGGRFLLENGKNTLLGASPEGDGDYWVVVFGDSSESLQAVLLNHVAYAVPR